MAALLSQRFVKVKTISRKYFRFMSITKLDSEVQILYTRRRIRHRLWQTYTIVTFPTYMKHLQIHLQ